MSTYIIIVFCCALLIPIVLELACRRINRSRPKGYTRRNGERVHFSVSEFSLDGRFSELREHPLDIGGHNHPQLWNWPG